MNKDTREQLILEHRPLVYMVAKRFLNRGYDKEELFQIGVIGLMKAIDRFDEDYGVAFSTYAVPLIMGEIKRFLRDSSIVKVSRSLKEQGYHIARAREQIERECGRDATLEEIETATGLSKEKIVAAIEANREVYSLEQAAYVKDGETISVGEQISNNVSGNDRSDEKEALLNRMTVEQLVQELSDRDKKLIHYRYYMDKTQTETASLLGISQVQVSRLEKKILLSLRQKM